ncbi:MAG: class II histone deacetylase [Dehalococcoidia bacterium]|nr:class II histone deacetylase [Dehalococcoidia bacterium]
MHRAAWLSHELFYWHDTGRWAGVYAPGPQSQPLGHVESEASKRRIESLLAVSGVLDHMEHIHPRLASDEEITAVHTPAHIAHVEAMAARGGDAGRAAPVGFHSARAARLAAGAGIMAVEAALGDGPRRAYCLTRPPGHHAEREHAIGFCLYNNVAIAAQAARRAGVQRIAVVDWDVHHGNGTQQAAWDDPDFLFISVHQEGLFPLHSGPVHDVGGPGAEGSVINVPLQPGSGHGAYLHALERVILPALRAFQPGLILVSAGQDGGFYDPMGRQMCVPETYNALARGVIQAADELCDGRIVMFHEGGYSEFHTPFCTRAIVTELAGLDFIEDPAGAWTLDIPGQSLQPHQEQRVAEVVGAHRSYGLLS